MNDLHSIFAAGMRAGRVMQRLWLTATRSGLSVQPMASLPLLSLRAA